VVPPVSPLKLLTKPTAPPSFLVGERYQVSRKTTVPNHPVSHTFLSFETPAKTSLSKVFQVGDCPQVFKSIHQVVISWN
jgi:hypothetical protein